MTTAEVMLGIGLEFGVEVGYVFLDQISACMLMKLFSKSQRNGCRRDWSLISHPPRDSLISEWGWASQASGASVVLYSAVLYHSGSRR